ncbi:MAG: cation transporter [Acidobacteria bacterium]|nr:cation transporter [Acidobacteriota bacterium]
MKRCLTAFVGVMVFAITAMGQVREVRVRVEAFDCTFCAYGLEKRLQKLDAVRSVSLDRTKAVLTVTAKPGKDLAIDELIDAVKRIDAVPKEVEISATGRIEHWQGNTTLLVSEKQRLILEPADKARQIEAASEGGKRTVSVTGIGKYPAAFQELPYKLAVTSFQAP